MDVHCEVRITLRQAILGGNVAFSGPYGNHIEMQIPPGTQPGDIIAVAGAGVRGTMSKTHGDVKARITVALPKTLSPRSKRLLEELCEDLSKTPLG
jgi:molecular chaperone DnaJ